MAILLWDRRFIYSTLWQVFKSSEFWKFYILHTPFSLQKRARFRLKRTKKQYPSGSYTQDISVICLGCAVLTGHSMVDPLPSPQPPLPCDASFLKSKCKWNFVFKWLESLLISLCYEVPGLISTLSNSENRFWSWFTAMLWSWFESYRVCHQTTSPDKVSAH